MFIEKRKDELLKFIADHIKEKGYSPTYREMGDKFSLTPMRCHQIVHMLAEDGKITIDGDGIRNISIK